MRAALAFVVLLLSGCGAIFGGPGEPTGDAAGKPPDPSEESSPDRQDSPSARNRELVESLGSTEDGVADSSLRELVIVGKPAVPELVAGLRSEDAGVRGRSAAALGVIRDESTVPEIGKLLADEDLEVRNRALLALLRIGDQRAVKPIVSSLENADPEYAARAAEGLKTLTGKDFGTDLEKWREWLVEIK